MTTRDPKAIGPIARDESYDRSYIPVAPGWEVQTKGKGSSFRLCDTTTDPSGDRLNVPDAPYLHDTIERMARATHAELSRLAAENAELREQYANVERRWEVTSEAFTKLVPEYRAIEAERDGLRIELQDTTARLSALETAVHNCPYFEARGPMAGWASAWIDKRAAELLRGNGGGDG